MKTDIVNFIKERDIVILNGAMGTELQRRGYKTALPLWSAQANLDAWDLVKEIHEDYFKAGADISITNTFRTTPRSFAKVGRKNEARLASQKAVEACKDAQNSVARKTFIGGSIAPLEDCYEPEKVPSEQELLDEHAIHAEWLKSDDVDFLILETINALPEAIAVTKAAINSGLPYIISFVVNSEGQLLDGTPLAVAVKETQHSSRLSVGVNCRPIHVIDSAFEILRNEYKEAITIYPNGFGKPCDDLGWKFENNEDSIETFVAITKDWHDKGAKIIGGCCGTTPDYIAALSEAFTKIKSNAT